MPTTAFWFPGDRIDPEVSVPTATVQKPAATATAEPLLEPPGPSSVPYGLMTWPPRELYPAGIPVVMKLAHSVMLALPRLTTPTSRSLVTRNASRGATQSFNSSDRALV